MLDSFVSRYQAGVTGSTELLLQSHFSHLRDGATSSCSVSPCVAEGTLPPRVAACGRLKAAVVVQEHCFGEGISELNSSNMPSGRVRGMPSFGAHLPLSPRFADRLWGGSFSAGLRERWA